MASGSSSGSSSSKPATTTTTTPASPPPALTTEFWHESANAALCQELRKAGPWLRGKIEGRQVPGIFSVEVTPASRKIDIQSPSGKTGAKLVDKGIESAKVSCKIQIFTPAQWSEYLNYFEGKLSVRSKACVTILHPQLDLARVSSVLVSKDPKYDYNEAEGIVTVSFEGIDASVLKTTGTSQAKPGTSTQSDKLKSAYIEYVKLYRDTLKQPWLNWSSWCVGYQALNPPPPCFPGYAAYAPP